MENNFEKESALVIDELLKCNESDKWEVVATSEKDVILKNLNAEDNSNVSFKRSEGLINVNAKKLFEYLWNQKFEDKKHHETMLADDRILKEINDNRHLRYQKYNFPWPLTSRDTLILRNKFLKKIGEDDW